MILTWIMFSVAICLSAVAAFYSIVGLAAIFSAAVMPIVIMGTILEIAKLTVTVWLHEYWRQCRWIMKAYLVPAVVVLMIITSMGIFGFLSKAHIDQIIPTGDRSAQLALFDERIANERSTIENSRSLIRQMDDTVNGIIAKGESREIRLGDGRIIVRSPAELALQVRRSQARDRDALTNTIEEAQTRIVAMQEERAPIAREIRGLEAEVGPIKYVAALIYGDNPDTNLLERAVRWVIIILVAVFDPLAIMMLLAATESLSWSRQRKETQDEPIISTDHVTDEPDSARTIDDESHRLESEMVSDDFSKESVTLDLENQQTLPAESARESRAYLETSGRLNFKNQAPMVAAVTSTPPADSQTDAVEDGDDDIDEQNYVIKQAKSLWKQDNPRNTLKEQRRLLGMGVIDRLPWEDYIEDPRIKHEIEFGRMLPATGRRGEMFVLTNQVPSQLYKHNGNDWMLVDKYQTDLYTYNHAYIDYLIASISAGDYDPDLLTDGERDQIESRLQREQP